VLVLYCGAAAVAKRYTEGRQIFCPCATTMSSFAFSVKVNRSTTFTWQVFLAVIIILSATLAVNLISTYDILSTHVTHIRQRSCLLLVGGHGESTRRTKLSLRHLLVHFSHWHLPCHNLVNVGSQFDKMTWNLAKLPQLLSQLSSKGLFGGKAAGSRGHHLLSGLISFLVELG